MAHNCSGYAAREQGGALAPFDFDRRGVGDKDIAIAIQFCGVCHSDLSMVENEWGYALYPLVPGHEIIGRVTAVGKSVDRFKVGDIAAVGTIVDSCRTCANCSGDLEQYCEQMPTQTYSTPQRVGSGITYGGYSTHYVVDQHFAFHVPASLDPAGAAPLLCAGITTYSPLKRWNTGPGKRVGIVGFGGLGHVAVKFAHAMGAHVTVFTTTPGKEDDARGMGADAVVLSTDADAMAGVMGSLDFILDTVAVPHDVPAYLPLLKTHGTMCLVGLPGEPIALMAHSLAYGGKSLAGSGVGGMAETQEMLDFAGEHGIEAEIEIIALDQINEAFDRLKRNDVRFRFVIAMEDAG